MLTTTTPKTPEIFQHGEQRVANGWQIRSGNGCVSLVEVRNAGVRGAKCATFQIDSWHHMGTAGPSVLARDIQIAALSSDISGDQMESVIRYLVLTVADRAMRCEDFAAKATITRDDRRGVDVAMPVIEVSADGIYIRADGLTGSVSDARGDGNIRGVDRSKRAARKFYDFVTSRTAELATKTYDEVLAMLAAEGIPTNWVFTYSD